MASLIVLLSLFSPPLLADEGLLTLNTKKSHLDVRMASQAPVLKFYDKKTNQIRIEVNEKGAFVNLKLVCAWPGGLYSAKNSANMVLGFSTPGGVEVKPCPQDLPIKSTWGDGGTGTAVLYVEVDRVEASIAEVRYHGEKLALDLRGLKYKVKKPGSLRNEPGD